MGHIKPAEKTASEINKFPSSSDPKCLDLLAKAEKHLMDLSESLNIEVVQPDFFKTIVIPISKFLNSLPKRDKPYVICLTGSQGSGKSTLANFIQNVLARTCGRPCVGFSIDDIYKSPEERRHLADTIHPLCYVRGVPGTHNVKMGINIINALSKATENTLTAIPSFSKLLDKHGPEEKWKKYTGKPDFIFFDAWCGGAKPISEANWAAPINDLEKEEDPDGVWSKWSNKELSGDYQDLFNMFDMLFMIRVPSMDFVYQSRWLQEQTLYKTLKDDPDLAKKVMTKKEVYRFVMHYERLTHYVLKEIPKFASLVLDRDDGFNFSISKTP